MLYSVLETMGDGFSSKFKELFALLSNTIKDPESLEVRVNTMLAISKMALVIDAEEDQASIKAFQNIFPSLVAVLKDTIDSGKEDQIMLAFEVFNTLLTGYQFLDAMCRLQTPARTRVEDGRAPDQEHVTGRHRDR